MFEDHERIAILLAFFRMDDLSSLVVMAISCVCEHWIGIWNVINQQIGIKVPGSVWIIFSLSILLMPPTDLRRNYLTLTHCGKPTWTEEDFQQFLFELGYRGYGWLRPEGV